MRVSLGFAFIALTYAGFLPEAGAEDVGYPEALAAARSQFRLLINRVEEADAKAELYPPDLLEAIAQFYHSGSSNDRVQRIYCREQALRLYRAMFYLTPSTRDIDSDVVDNNHRLMRYVDAETAAALQKEVKASLETAFEDLSVPQRKMLYHLSGNILAPGDGDALQILENMYHRDDATPDERLTIDAAIAEIQRQGLAQPTEPDR